MMRKQILCNHKDKKMNKGSKRKIIYIIRVIFIMSLIALMTFWLVAAFFFLPFQKDFYFFEIVKEIVYLSFIVIRNEISFVD